jgi:hypothetical protein
MWPHDTSAADDLTQERRLRGSGRQQSSRVDAVQRSEWPACSRKGPQTPRHRGIFPPGGSCCQRCCPLEVDILSSEAATGQCRFIIRCLPTSTAAQLGSSHLLRQSVYLHGRNACSLVTDTYAARRHGAYFTTTCAVTRRIAKYFTF